MRELNSREIQSIAGGFDGFLIGCIGGVANFDQDSTMITATMIGGVWGGIYGLKHYALLGILGIPLGAFAELGMAFIGYKFGSLLAQSQATAA